MTRTRERTSPDAEATPEQHRFIREHNLPGWRMSLTFGEAAKIIGDFKAIQPPSEDQLELAAKLNVTVLEGHLHADLKDLLRVELNRRARVAMAKDDTFIRVGVTICYKGQDYTIEQIFTKYGELKVTLEPLAGRRRGRTYKRMDVSAGYLTMGDTREIGVAATSEVTIR